MIVHRSRIEHANYSSLYLDNEQIDSVKFTKCIVIIIK